MRTYIKRLRPERLKTLKLEEYPTLEEYKKLHDYYIENIYNESPHQGEGMFGKSPRQVYEENLFERRTTTKDAMRLWLMRTTKPYTVQRNGIKIFGSCLSLNYYHIEFNITLVLLQQSIPTFHHSNF